MNRIRTFITLFVATAIAWLLLPAVAFAQALTEASEADGGGITTGSQLLDITLTGVLVGSVLPNVIAIFVQPRWRSELRGLVTFVICFVAAGVVAFLQGSLDDATDWGAAISSVLLSSQIMYQTLWKPSGIAPAIERGTSVT
jgi:cadmium resistance protein CadD (predicted permease)